MYSGAAIRGTKLIELCPRCYNNLPNHFNSIETHGTEKIQKCLNCKLEINIFNDSAWYSLIINENLDAITWMYENNILKEVALLSYNKDITFPVLLPINTSIDKLNKYLILI